MTVYRFNKETGKIETKPDEQPAWVLPFGNPTIRTHSNGKHRRPSPQAHRDSTDRTSTGPGGTFTWSTIHNPGTFNLSPGAVNYTRGSGKGLAHAQLIQKALMAFGYYEWEEPKPPILPYAGIRTGEIIGHRLWWVLPDGLYSLAHNFRWEPGTTIEGKLDEIVFGGNIAANPIYGGVYAYASCKVFLENEYTHYQTALATSPPRRLTLYSDHPVNHAIGLIRGTVKLWGDIIEHEKGWRAQFAKLASIEEWYGDAIEVPKVLQPYYDSLKEKPCSIG